MNYTAKGPKFELASDELFIVGGNSERKEVMDFFASKLDERRLFEDINVVTLNRLDTKLGRGALFAAFRESTVLSHSSGLTRVPRALQIIAMNPPEPITIRQQIERASEIVNDQVVKEPGHHKTGSADMLKAGLQLAGSPISTFRTMSTIKHGYSGSNRLIGGVQDFPAGRALVHSDQDGFGFAELADMDVAASCGVTTLMLHGHHHNEYMFAPDLTIDLMTPTIFPDTRS